MDIQYLTPLSRGWGRMKKGLFQPFDLKKWFVVGFTAFLAGLTDWKGGGLRITGESRADWDELMYFPDRAWQWLLDNPGWFTLIGIGVFFVFILFVLFTWLSSRGKFMFLDNVVHNRAQVVKPWCEYRVEGNSLFLWRFVLGIIVFAIIPSGLALQKYGAAVIGIVVVLAVLIDLGRHKRFLTTSGDHKKRPSA